MTLRLNHGVTQELKIMIELPKTQGVAFIGIDPGKKGAVQIVYLDQRKLLTLDLESLVVGKKFDGYAYHEWLKSNLDLSYNFTATCELVRGWGDIAANAAFNWGELTGSVKQGLISGYGIRIGLREPNNWKAWYKKRYPNLKIKTDYLKLAKKLFPYFADCLHTTDQADALLIGYCGFTELMELRSQVKHAV